MTKLTGLTRLDVRTIAQDPDPYIMDGVCLKCSKRDPTPVWQQLQALCRDTFEGAKMLLGRAEAALTESRHRLAATHQQFSAVQHQVQQALQAGPGAEQHLRLQEVQHQLMAAVVELAAGVDMSNLDGQVHGSAIDAGDLSSGCSSDTTSDDFESSE